MISKIIDIKLITKADLKHFRVSMGVRHIVERKGSVMLGLTEAADKNNVSYQPLRFFRKIQKAKSGSFMQATAVKEFINTFDPARLFLSHLNPYLVLIEGTVYVPTSEIQKRLTEAEWRMMQSKVTTFIFDCIC